MGVLRNPIVASGFDVSPGLSEDHVLFDGHLTLLSDSTVFSEVDHGTPVNSPER
jgi:hypothetical protein